MIRNDTRESAHLKSRVKDLSVVPNVVSFTGLFAAITPIAKLKRNEDDLYDPILIRDTDSLIANFGDPRIDPEKYIDLYSIMQVVGNGTSCYVAKVPSGTAGVYHFNFIPNSLSNGNLVLEPATGDETGTVYTVDATSPAVPSEIMLTGIDSSAIEFISASFEVSAPEEIEDIVEDAEEAGGNIYLTRDQLASVSVEYLEEDAREDADKPYRITVTFKAAPTNANTAEISKVQFTPSMTAYSSMTEDITIDCTLTQAKPYSLKVFYLNITAKSGNNVLGTAKIKLQDTTTNQEIINNLNTAIGTYLRFELDPEYEDYAQAAERNNLRDYSIANVLLNVYAPHEPVPGSAEIDSKQPRADLVNKTTELDRDESNDTHAVFKVELKDYENTYNQFKDKRYPGCIMADLNAPLHHVVDNRADKENDPKDEAHNYKESFGVPTPEERRSLHYYLKQVACERKDTTVILSTPFRNNDDGSNNLTRFDGTTPFTLDEICDWVASQNKYADLWNYGETNTTDYSIQSFYLEIYSSWLKWQCTWVDNGIAKSKMVETAPSCLVINNILTSYRERGVHYPVAGDQYGVLPDTCTVLQNPKTKLERDQLVQYRINPIWDTGTRGIQIFGNETLNAGYTDLNAAHIARALVYIRSTIDEYTEKLKFSINSLILWDTWKNYVTNYILEPLKAANCLAEYAVAMGTDTTSAAEIANRKINGNISLRFYQSAEIFDLTYTVYSSATTLAEAMGNV